MKARFLTVSVFLSLISTSNLMAKSIESTQQEQFGVCTYTAAWTGSQNGGLIAPYFYSTKSTCLQKMKQAELHNLVHFCLYKGPGEYDLKFTGKFQSAVVYQTQKNFICE